MSTKPNATQITFVPLIGTTTTVHSKLLEFVSVKDFGAVGDGTNSTIAFSNAAKNAPAIVNIVGAEGELPRALSCSIFVPAGTYELSSVIDTGGREITWVLDAAAKIIGYQYLNGKVLRPGQRQADYHHGTTDYSCTYSIRSNTDLEDGAEILGVTAPGQLASYTDRDSVSLYVDNASVSATVDVASVVGYTSNTVTIAAPSNTTLLQYRRGMIIDTKHSPKWTGMVDSWDSTGSVITVTAWYRVGENGVASTPTGTNGCVINGMTKVWAHNANVTLSSTGYASSACGFELGMFNYKAASSSDFNDETNRCWGFDSVNHGTYIGQAAYITRGNWHHGFYARNQGGIGFSSWGNGAAFVAQDTANNTYFLVTDSGGVTVSVGKPSIVGAPTIDFNSSGETADYDTRLIAYGGSTTTGKGTLAVRADNFLVENTTGFGYGAGSGGTVTQSTSKTTAVTLNKSCGQITMHNAALNNGSSVAFSVNNSTATGMYTVIVGACDNGNYTVMPQYFGEGNFGIRVTNASGITQAEALKINFTIIKGSVS